MGFYIMFWRGLRYVGYWGIVRREWATRPIAVQFYESHSGTQLVAFGLGTKPGAVVGLITGP